MIFLSAQAAATGYGQRGPIAGDLSGIVAPGVRGSKKAGFMTLPPLPGGEMTFTPMQASAQPAVDPVESARQAQQRAQDLANDLRAIGPLENLPATGSAEFGKLRTAALAIMQRRFQASRETLEADTATDFAANVTWVPDFSAAPRTIAPADRDRARTASYPVAYAITFLDRPRFVLAYAAAVFALNPDGDVEAENAASAILACGERTYPTQSDAARLAPFREDAALVYRYALACSVIDGKWTLRSAGILINLGNLYVDMKSPERARPVLLAAHTYTPDSWDAALAFASCYMLQNQPDLARAMLENKALARPALYATATRGAAAMDETRNAPDLSPDSPDEAFETVLQKFAQQEILTAADFVDEIDQSTRIRMRHFVDDLPVQGSYRAPDIHELTQFSTVQSINRPLGIRALGDFAERLGGYSMFMIGSMLNRQADALAKMGLNVQMDVDLNDLLAHPEKYKDRKINATVTGVEALKARVEGMKRRAEQGRRDLASGNTAAIIQAATSSGSSAPIYALKPYDFANPMDVMIQQYNASVLGRKIHAYNASFFAVNSRTRTLLGEIVEQHAHRQNAIRQAEDVELDGFIKRKAEAEAAGQDVNTAQWKLLEHHIHTSYMPRYNAEADIAWKEATLVAAKAYTDKIKPRAERFYYDVFRHIALISDPAVREKKNRDFQQMLHFAVYQGLANVLGAFGSGSYVEEWDCHCDVGALEAQAEEEQRALDQIDNERSARQQQDRLRFESGEIPASSPLFKKLDEYGTDLDIPFLTFLTGRISCARTNLTLTAKLPTALSPKGTYTFSESAFTGATTYGGSVEVSVKAKEGPVSVGATLNLRGGIALDGHGAVTDYSVTGASNVTVGAGPFTTSIGGEIGYTPQGGITSDVSSGVKASFSDTYGRSGEVSVDASARRGSTLSAEAEQNFNPYSDEINGFLKDVMGPLREFFPVDTSIKQEIWSGKFTL